MKDSILEICKTMYEAHKNIKSVIEKKNFDSMNIVLGDCQSTAIQLGEVIEQSEGEGFVTVSYLEEYCEELYKVSTSVNESFNANKAQKSLDKILIKIENSVKNDINVILEQVFLVYKASMLDSVESVWAAASQDPNCNAHMMPIPYYDRNPDGSLGEMHYEGADFPEYIPLVHYEAYNLEKMRPDVIYIMNPYDNNNFVTCVDPRFHSDKLATYTDCLVYIPYFVVDESKSIEKINHYALAPGVINSDYVIVQSEIVRQKYIDVLLPHYGNTPEAKRFLENKILGLGSPKFDAVKRDKPAIESLPEEWQQIIGEKKRKIILYNTHLSLFMAGNAEKAFIKLKNVFDLFKRRDDVILLWRPHPLTLSTIQSMNPSVYDEYVSLVDDYKKSGFGIYDDTPDMDRAIALSDAYYGSTSSMVPIYKATGKPVLIHDINIISDFSEEI